MKYRNINVAQFVLKILDRTVRYFFLHIQSNFKDQDQGQTNRRCPRSLHEHQRGSIRSENFRTNGSQLLHIQSNFKDQTQDQTEDVQEVHEHQRGSIRSENFRSNGSQLLHSQSNFKDQDQAQTNWRCPKSKLTRTSTWLNLLREFQIAWHLYTFNQISKTKDQAQTHRRCPHPYN